jgi:glucose-6-phosphate-specific signal transduction histidine kinase
MNDSQRSKELYRAFHYQRYLPVYIIISFLTGCLIMGVLFHHLEAGDIVKLDKKFASEQTTAVEAIKKLEKELGQERKLNLQLQKYNNKARTLTNELKRTAGRNIGTLRDASEIISEIRSKLEVLADMYNFSEPLEGGN